CWYDRTCQCMRTQSSYARLRVQRRRRREASRGPSPRNGAPLLRMPDPPEPSFRDEGRRPQGRV
ncbi:hypothetical protein PIB30_116047, partial [Stylosanthes scabra]|nr:hypothetical protein [Stylosanthes scabra]